jgi:hypothetical protein
LIPVPPGRKLNLVSYAPSDTKEEHTLTIHSTEKKNFRFRKTLTIRQFL